jgi:hypothetical protein
LFFKPAEKLVQKLHRFFRVDSHRRKKQLVWVALILTFIITALFTTFKLMVSVLWLEDSLIGLKILLLLYMYGLTFIFGHRYEILQRDWVSLVPFDLYYDVVNFIKFLLNEIIKKRIIDPTTIIIKKCANFVAKVLKKCFDFMVKWLKKGADKVEKVGKKVADFTVKTSMLFYEKVIKPLYVQIADKIRKLINVLVVVSKHLYKAVKTVLTAFYNGIVAVCRSVYSGIYAIFSNANRLYFFVLKKSMDFLLGFGLLGNLLFTFWGLFLMTLPSIIWWTLYSKRWYLIVSTIHTMVLIVTGYKHLNRLRKPS